jgi:hypothetical protein
MKSYKFLAIAMMALALSACGPNLPQQEYIPAPQAQGHGDAAVGALVGAGAGYMLGRASGNNQPRTVIVDRRPVYGYGGYGGRKTVTTTTTRRGAFGTTTRTVTRRR